MTPMLERVWATRRPVGITGRNARTMSRVSGSRLWQVPAVVAAALTVAVAGGQTWKPESGRDDLRPGDGEITVEQALKSCSAFFERLGMPVPEGAPRVDRPKIRGERSRAYGFGYQHGGFLLVEAKTGAVVGFMNSGHVAAGGRPLRGDLDAQMYLRALAKRLGATDKHKMTDYRSRFGVQPEVNRPMERSSVSAVFQTMPFGYRFRGSRDGFAVVVDPGDGALIEYHRIGPRPYTIESHEAKLKFEQANAIARPLALKRAVGQWRSTDGNYAKTVPTAAQPSYLAYVVPNGEFGEPKYTDKPDRLRLAWVLCYPRHEEIWIDAGDGKVLGGVYFARGL